MKKPNKYLTKNLKSWNGFKIFTSNLSQNWIFRGQGDSSWELKSSIERTNFIKLYEDIEQSFLIEFKRGAKNFLTEKEIPDNLIEWLALMQHHGAPTRLLDFTKSALIAVFFAFENLFQSAKSVAIWGINEHILNLRLNEYLELRHDEKFEEARMKFSDEDYDASRRKYTYKDFEDIFYLNSKSCIMPVEPFNMNKRYALQQSIFISSGNSFDPLMDQLEFLGKDIEKTIVKICLPTTLQKEVLKDLQKMNITRTTLFPDLDGFANGLKMKYNLILSPSDDAITQYQSYIKNKKRLYP